MRPAERIATFDNDSTLWCEKPHHVQAEFLLRRWKAMVHADPAKANERPYKAPSPMGHPQTERRAALVGWHPIGLP